MKTNFTKGNWFVSGGSQIVSMPSQCKISNHISGWNESEAKANRVLIAAAPAMLRTLLFAYLDLQILVMARINEGSTALAVYTDSIRASLLNTICKATGIEHKEMQEFIELLANRVSRNIITRDSAYKELKSLIE